jgi:nucleosome assembly protein 1-like 1
MIEHTAEEENDNFSIKFYFSPNEYIENESLSVRFVMFSEDQVEKTVGNEIKWKAGKDITKKTITHKQRNKKTGKTREVTKTIDAESFFNFFKSIEVKEYNPEEQEEDEEEGDIEVNIFLYSSRTSAIHCRTF